MIFSYFTIKLTNINSRTLIFIKYILWNIRHFTFTGAIVYTITSNYFLGILGVVVHAAIAYKFGDWFRYDIKNYFELEGIAIPHGSSAWNAPIAVLVDYIIDKIPGLSKVNINSEKLERRLGIFGRPTMVAIILGVLIGIFAGYDVKNTLQLAMKVAAVIYLMPKAIKPIMDGLLPISEIAKEKLSKKYGGENILIGLDPALLLGDEVVISSGLLFIPLTILIAVLMPGNVILPFGDLATIGFFIAMAVAIHKGNIFRTLISGSVIISMTIWIANKMIPFTTKMALASGALTDTSAKIAALDQGGCQLTYLFSSPFFSNINLGYVLIAVIYILGLILTYKRAKSLEK